MKKVNYMKLAALGITSGIIIAKYPSVLANTEEVKTEYSQSTPSDPADLTYDLMTEKEVLQELDEEGKKLYYSLDENGKKLAREVVSQTCNGLNVCAGLNACRTNTNSCKGQGACKGQSICAHSDKNLAVKLVVQKLEKGKAKNNSQPQYMAD